MKKLKGERERERLITKEEKCEKKREGVEGNLV